MVPPAPGLKPWDVLPLDMTREPLQEASDILQEAAESATDPEQADRLRTQADEFQAHATDDRGPDHGRLARHERILADVAEAEGAEVAAKVDDALDAIHAYRETIEGV